MTYFVKTNNDGIIKSTVYHTDKKILDVCQVEYSKLLENYDIRGLKYRKTNESSFIMVTEFDDISECVAVEKECNIEYDIPYEHSKHIQVTIKLQKEEYKLTQK